MLEGGGPVVRGGDLELEEDAWAAKAPPPALAIHALLLPFFQDGQGGG